MDQRGPAWTRGDFAMTDYRLISSDSHVTIPVAVSAGAPPGGAPRPRPAHRRDRRGRLHRVRGQADPDQHPQQPGGKEARGLHAQRPQARRPPRRRRRPGRAAEGHGHSTASTPRCSTSVARCMTTRHRAAARQHSRLQPLAGRLLLVAPRSACSGWPRCPSTPPSSRSTYVHERRRRSGCAGGVHPALPRRRRRLRQPGSGTRCGRRSSETGLPIGLHVGGRRPGTPTPNLYESARRSS